MSEKSENEQPGVHELIEPGAGAFIRFTRVVPGPDGWEVQMSRFIGPFSHAVGNATLVSCFTLGTEEPAVRLARWRGSGHDVTGWFLEAEWPGIEAGPWDFWVVHAGAIGTVPDG